MEETKGYVTADSYKNWEYDSEPYEKNGKLYIDLKTKCDRCVNGIYAVGVENGHIKPHPAYGGVCLKCGGSGIMRKAGARLYTLAEYEKNKKYAENARLRKQKKLEEKMLSEAKEKKTKWLAKNGFDEDGNTYIILGNTYPIKDVLKDAGWTFSYNFLWHKEDPAGYEDRVIKLNLDEVGSWTVYGQFVFNEDAANYIQDKINSVNLHSKSEWIEGDRIVEEEVTLESISGFEGYYGYTNIYNFVTKEGNKVVWFTSTTQDIEVGDSCFLSGKIKERKMFKNEKITVVTRCRIS